MKKFEETKEQAKTYIKSESRRIAAQDLRKRLDEIKAKFGESQPGSLRPEVSAVAQKKYLALIAETLIAILENADYAK